MVTVHRHRSCIPFQHESLNVKVSHILIGTQRLIIAISILKLCQKKNLHNFISKLRQFSGKRTQFTRLLDTFFTFCHNFSPSRFADI